MAKIIEHTIGLKISKIVSDDSNSNHPLTENQYAVLVAGMAELALTLLNDPSCVIEITTVSE